MPASVEADDLASPARSSSAESLLSAAQNGPQKATFRPFRSQKHQQQHRRRPRPTVAAVDHRPWLTALVVTAVCVVGSVAIVRAEWNHDDDGASVVPLVALAGIALAALRWRPTPQARPSRDVTTSSAVMIATVATALAVTLAVWPSSAPLVAGPTVSVAIVGTYLALWGHRLLALLRAVTVMSLLAWQPVAEFAHGAIRTSLEQPSGLIYRRLAQIPVFNIDNEPWRLFSAELHRGALVVLATFVLSIGANRWRLSPSTALHLLATMTAALIAHHVVILASPIDEYAPGDVTQLATNPTLELAISALAVAGLSLIRTRRRTVVRKRIEADRATSEPAGDVDDDDQNSAAAAPPPERAHRDPVIFAMSNRMAHPAITALLLSGVAPLAALALAP